MNTQLVLCTVLLITCTLSLISYLRQNVGSTNFGNGISVKRELGFLTVYYKGTPVSQLLFKSERYSASKMNRLLTDARAPFEYKRHAADVLVKALEKRLAMSTAEREQSQEFFLADYDFEGRTVFDISHAKSGFSTSQKVWRIWDRLASFFAPVNESVLNLIATALALPVHVVLSINDRIHHKATAK